VIDVEEANRVQQREITLEMVQRWIAEGHIQGVRLPSDIPESEINRLLTEMFSLPKPFETTLDEVEVEIEDSPI
jgi:hypothetical protein